jgi:hypothetical protein
MGPERLRRIDDAGQRRDRSSLSRRQSLRARHVKRLQTSLSLVFDYERPIAILNALVGQSQPQIPVGKERS